MKAYAQQHQPRHVEEASRLTHSRRAPESQAIRRSLRERAEGARPPSATTRFAHDFSRIPARSEATHSLQAQLKINAPGDRYEQEADRIADEVTAAAPRLSFNEKPQRVQRLSGQTSAGLYTAPPGVARAGKSGQAV